MSDLNVSTSPILYLCPHISNKGLSVDEREGSSALKSNISMAALKERRKAVPLKLENWDFSPVFTTHQLHGLGK